MDFEINTYWNVDVTYQVMNGVSAVMQSGGYLGLIKLTFLVMCLISLIAFMWNRDMGFFKWFIQAMIFTMLLNMPIARVVLIDNLSQQPPKIAQNVPWVMAAGSALINNTTGWFVKTYETVFNIPGALSISGTGDMGYGQALVKHANRITITDPVLRSDIMQFFKECTIYDIQDGVIGASDISSSPNTWNTIFTSTNPARLVTMGTIGGANRSTVTCIEAGVQLQERVNNGLESSMRYYGKSFFNRFSDDVAYNMYLNSLGTSYSWMLGSNQSASDAIKQSMFNNVWREAGTELPALLGDPSRVAEITANAGAAMGATQVKGSMSVVTKLAYEVIPQLRNWLEAIMYSIFPIVLILLILSKAENMMAILGAYFSSYLALGIIPIFFAIINHISLLYMRMKADALDFAQGVPFGQMGVLEGTLIDEQTTVGYMVILSVAFAGWLAFKMNGSITGVGQRMLTSWAAAGSAGSSLASGNASIGEQTIDNVSANNTNMNKMDTSQLYNNNGRTYVGNDGTRTLYNNGDVATQYHNNDLHYGAMVGSGISRNLGSERSQEIGLSKNQNFDANTTNGSTYSNESYKGQGRNNLQGIGVNTTNGVTGGDRRDFNHNLGVGSTSSEYSNYGDTRSNEQVLSGGVAGNAGVALPSGGGSHGGSINPNTGTPGATSQGIPGVPNRNGQGAPGQGAPGQGAPGQGAPAGRGGNLPGYGSLGAHGGVDFRYSEGANVGQGAEVRNQGDRNDGVNQNIYLDNNGSRVDSNEIQRQSNQDRGVRESASVFNNNQVTSGESANLNQGSNSRETASLNESRTLNFEQDYGRSVSHASDVARANGYSPMEFSQLPQSQQMALNNQYVMDKESKSLQMPTEYMNGDKVQNNSEYFVSFDKYKNEIAERYGLENRTQSNFDRVGVSKDDVKPLSPNISTPAIIRNAEGVIDGKVEELSKDEKDLKLKAKEKTDYDQNLTIDSKIQRDLQDKLGNVDTWFNKDGDAPKK